MSALDDLIADIDGTAGQPAQGPRTPMPPPAPMSAFETLLSKVPAGLVNNPLVTAARGVVQGAADPTIGAAALAANALPDSTGIPAAVNSAISKEQADYQASRGQNAGYNVKLPVLGNVNIDPARIAGNALSPVNLAMAVRAAPAVGAGARAIQGAKLGFAGGAAAPVDVDPETGKYWGQKAAQVALGTGFGAAFAPVVGAIGDRVAKLISSFKFSPAEAGANADSIISDALKETGQGIGDIPPAQLDAIRQQVTQALSKGERLDAGALMRMQDFQSAGIKPLQGWVTRDPMQFAAEANVRGIPGVGDDIMAAIQQANAATKAGINSSAQGAQEPWIASQNLADSLRNIDNAKAGAVGAAYTAARNQAAGSPEIPMQPLAQRFGEIIDALPERVKNSLPLGEFNQYGLLGGTQTKSFGYNEAEKLLQSINASSDNTPATAWALGQLRGAVKDAVAGTDAAGGPFAGARQLAAQRFQLHEDAPALGQAVNGSPGDDFVQRSIVGAKSTPQVQALASLLRENDPATFQQMRSQIGAYLADKAVGPDTAGTKLVNQASYNKALESLGSGKLEAFFSPDEIDRMRLWGRVAAYQTEPPAGSAVNYSNTASAMANLLRSVGHVLPIGKGAMQTLGDKMVAKSSLNATVPSVANMTDAQRLALSYILSGGSAAGGLALSSGLVGK